MLWNEPDQAALSPILLIIRVPTSSADEPNSVKEFPGPDELVTLLREAGFASASYELQTFGIAAIHVAGLAR